MPQMNENTKPHCLIEARPPANSAFRQAIPSGQPQGAHISAAELHRVIGLSTAYETSTPIEKEISC